MDVKLACESRLMERQRDVGARGGESRRAHQLTCCIYADSNLFRQRRESFDLKSYNAYMTAKVELGIKCMAAINIPNELVKTREAALLAIQPIRPVDENTQGPKQFLLTAQETKASENLPPYYLIYFLLVDLLGFRDIGKSEKIAWSVPIDFNGQAFLVEYRKFGIGVFAHDVKDNEAQAQQIVRLITKGVNEAKPFFDWLAEQAVRNSELNVPNKSYSLFSRFNYFLGLYRKMADETNECAKAKDQAFEAVINVHNHSSELKRNSRWLALSTIDAFYSWTEHIFIHLAILLGKATSGEDVATLTEADWPDKFKKVLDLNEPEIKPLYDELILIRRQLRNYVAHGAFGKRGESFSFHSGTGAVPILFSHQINRPRFVLSDTLAFEEAEAMKIVEEFIQNLWSGDRKPAQLYIESGLPSILTMAKDGTYMDAMCSVSKMENLINHLSYMSDQASNMDW